MNYKISDFNKLLISTLLGILAIVLISFNYFGDVRDHLIENEQKQLLTIVESVASTIEQFFDNQSDNVKIITSNDKFINEFIGAKQSNFDLMEFESLKDYYLFEEDAMSQIALYVKDNQAVYVYPEGIYSDYKSIKDDLFSKRTTSLSELYKIKDDFYIDMFVPYTVNNSVEAVIAVQFPLKKIYDLYIADIRVGDKGYASVKDENLILIMHPKSEDIGENVIEARKGEFPDYDWSELEALVVDQQKGISGVGVYHSIWYHDEKHERVKKINAYAPAHVGDNFWIVNVSMDYLEMTEFIRVSTMKSIGLISVIILVFLTFMVYLYKLRKDKAQLEKEASYSRELNLLNQELEEDLLMRKKLQRTLEKNMAKYERLFNGASDCIFVLEELEGSYHIVEVNEKALNQLEYKKEEMIKMDFLTLSPESESLLPSLKSIEDKSGVEIFEDQLTTKSGGIIPVEISAHKLEILNEEKILILSRDISQRKIQEEALKRSQERFRKIVSQVASEININYDVDKDFKGINRFSLELEKLNIELEKMFHHELEENKKKEALMIYQSRLAAMGEMIGNIAHQWRQPLSTLSMVLMNMKDAYDHNELEPVYFEDKIKRSNDLIHHMSQTIDDFRYFFRPRQEASLFKIKDVLDYVERFLEDSLRLKEIDMRIGVDGDMEMWGLGNQLAQVVFTIVQNSVDAISDKQMIGGIIEIDVIENSQNIELVIKDNAGGFTDEALAKVFEPYFTTKEDKGTGLGLYMSKTVIEKGFRGNIDISNHGEGACIRLILPKEGA